MFGTQDINNWWPFLVFLAATGMLFFRLRLRNAMQKTSSREEGLERLKESNRRKSLEGMLVEIHDINRELTARVDNKLSIVSTIIKNIENTPQDKNLISKIDILESRIVELEKRLGVLEDGTQTKVDLDTQQCMYERQNRHAEVFKLFKDGLTSLEIAEQVGRQRGEIELILGLGGIDASSNTTV